jgi:hypothetical protein
MNITTRIHGKLEDGTKTRYVVTEDGRYWREPVRPSELVDLAPETLVYFGRGEPRQAGEFAGFCFPGGFPYLAGLFALGPSVYVEATQEDVDALREKRRTS